MIPVASKRLANVTRSVSFSFSFFKVVAVEEACLYFFTASFFSTFNCSLDYIVTHDLTQCLQFLL